MRFHVILSRVLWGSGGTVSNPTSGTCFGNRRSTYACFMHELRAHRLQQHFGLAVQLFMLCRSYQHTNLAVLFCAGA
jgi:hypothetical protein